MSRGKGPAQIMQMIAAQKERLRKEAENMERLEKLIVDVYGRPGAEGEQEEQDAQILEDYCYKMFVKNNDDAGEAVSTFTMDSRNHLNKLGALMYRAPKGPEIISEIRRQLKEKKKPTT